MAVARDAAHARTERLFFAAMAGYCAVTILGGFVPTFFLRGTLLAGAAPLRPLVFVHGALFTVWVVLFLTQTALISARRRVLHRRLGLAGLGVVTAIVAIGIPLIYAFEQSHGAERPATLAVHLFSNAAPLTLFAGFALAGIAWRQRSDVHKRLMLFATFALQPAGFARLIGYLGIGQAASIPAFAVLCSTCALYDWCVDRRVRPVSLLGALVLFGTVYATDLLFAYIESAPA
jgi:hypothetical protein